MPRARGFLDMLNYLANRWDSLILRWQLLRRTARIDIEPAADAATRELQQEVTRWAVQFLGAPHAMLGRPGAVCPFVRPSVELGRFIVCVQGAEAHTSLAQLRAVALGAARELLSRHPRQNAKSLYWSLVLVFPHLPESRHRWLDVLHDQLKTHLMSSLEVMSTPVHPHSTRPAISNPQFLVFRGPYPMLVLRHLDVRDIRFLHANGPAFKRYHARFAASYHAGKVSDEFGDVANFNAACARFGLEPGPAPANAQRA